MRSMSAVACPGPTTERLDPQAARRSPAATDEQLEFALHAGRMGSWELDVAAGRFTTSEYCRVVFGLGPDAPFDTTVEDVRALVLPEDRQETPGRPSTDAIAERTEMEVEYRTYRPDGSIGWVLARGRAAYENGRAVRMAGISLDITERRRRPSTAKCC